MVDEDTYIPAILADGGSHTYPLRLNGQRSERAFQPPRLMPVLPEHPLANPRQQSIVVTPSPWQTAL